MVTEGTVAGCSRAGTLTEGMDAGCSDFVPAPSTSGSAFPGTLSVDEIIHLVLMA